MHGCTFTGTRRFPKHLRLSRHVASQFLSLLPPTQSFQRRNIQKSTVTESENTTFDRGRRAGRL